ncbi:MAG TPA: glycosyltransferase [Thiobacillaceae bacterium]|nr:glycosyltransferase [Thiobacillaceae bacterium]HNU65125.1 glycosyltransferase [Thiobacillaceae bacterium]
MSEVALISLLWPKHHGLLSEYLGKQPRVVYTLSQYASDQLMEPVARGGGRVVALESLDAVAQESTRVMEAEQRARAVRQAFREAGQVPEPWTSLLAPEDLSKSLLMGMRIVDLLDAAASVQAVEVLLVSEEYMQLARTAVQWAKARGIPVVHVCHGANVGRMYTVHQPAQADLYCVIGEREGDFLADLGVPPNSLIPVGSMEWEDFLDRDRLRPLVHRELTVAHGLDAGLPTLVFGTTWFAGLTAFTAERVYDETIAVFLAACRDLRKAGVSLNCVIKDRPPNAAFAADRIAAIAAGLGMTRQDYALAFNEAMGWILAADVLVAVESTLLIEAMLAGTPAVNLWHDAGHVLGPAFGADEGIVQAFPDSLGAILERLLRDPEYRQHELAQARAASPKFMAAKARGESALRMSVVLEAVRVSMGREFQPQVQPPLQHRLVQTPQDTGKHYVWQSLGETAGEREADEFYPDVPRKEVVAQFGRSPRRVLEIGCATGATAMHIKALYPGTWVAGIELSEAAASVARGRMDLVISEKFEEADLEGQGIGHGSIDTVIVADVLEHMYDPWGALARLRPYLTLDAQVIASIPNARNLWLLNELANGRFPYAPVGLLDITHIRFFTRAEIEKLFAETGYAIDSWLRTPDPRLMHLKLQPGMTAVETEKLVLKDVRAEEFEDLKALQFVVRARPLASVEQATQAAAVRPRHGPRRIAVYSRDVRVSACPQLRFFRPFMGLHGAWELLWGVHEEGGGRWSSDLELDADIYVISRLYPGADTRAEIEAIFARGRPVIYETDDLLIDLPADNMHARDYAAHAPYIEAVMRRAQGVVVSTPDLAARLKDYNANVQVLPNLVDYALFNRTPPDNGRQVNIGVVGTSARGGDFALVDAALRAICQEYGKRIRVKFIGSVPEGWAGHPNAEAVPFTPDYGAYAARMKGLDLDIGLAPLAENTFNACKSPIKWLEFSALGMAGIYSHVPAYKDVIEQGKTGLLVDNKTEKWATALKLLVENPDYRLQIALAAQLKVYQEHSLQRRAHLVNATYGHLLERSSLAAGGEAVAAEPARADAEGPDYYALWQIGHGYREWDLRWMAERMEAWSDAPSVGVGVICRGGDEGLLANNIKSLSQQFHKGWRLVVVAEMSAPAGLDDLPQITWVEAAPDDALEALNRYLAEGNEDWVGMVEAGDRLALHATFTVADKALLHPEWRMLYTDEDRLAADGERHTPFFKTDFDPDMLRAAPFSLGGLFLLERGLFAELGGYRPEAEGVESWDLALRACERLADTQVGHLADVLYHRHEAGGHSRRESEAVWAAARDSLAGHLARLGLAADIGDGLLPGSFRIRYHIRGKPLVSVIVPTKNKVELLRTCLTSLIEGTGYSHCEVLVVDNGSDDADALAYLQALRDLGSNSLKVLSFPGSFNFSAMNNMAAREARGEFLLLLNNDTQILHEDWLEEMLGYAQRDDVGAVGARLLYPDGTIQHAGAILGLGGVGSNHVHQHAAGDTPGYYGRLRLPQGYSVLTAACLLTRKDHYAAVGGLDEEMFQVNFNDVDYCLKLRARGLKVVWTPHATLRHVESASQIASGVERLATDEKARRLHRELEAVVAKWQSWFANDPAYNRNLSLMLPFQPEPTPALSWDPEWRPAPRILTIHADSMGCGEYRIIAPMRALSGAGRVMGWDAAGYFHPREYARMDPDAIVFQRQVEWGQIEQMQRLARTSRAFRVFELDDLITNIPIMSSQKRLFVEQKDLNKRFRKAVGLCHRFVVSTDYLAEAFRGYCDEVVAVPNYLERARWGGVTATRRGGARARVGWAGSATHAGDLRLIDDVVKATAGEVDWIFLGMCPDAIRPLVKEFHEPVKLGDYAAKLASLDLDLAIAPLEDIPFNHGKSHLRLLEYGVLGYPVLCTDLTPYRGAYPVTRVPNKFKAWVEAIRELVADRAALARQGDVLREHIQGHWMLEDHLDIWLRAWMPR